MTYIKSAFGSEESLPRPCVKCDYDRLARDAKARGARLEFRKAPLLGKPFGVRLYELKPGKVHGTFLRWYEAKPVSCMCRQMKTIVNRSGPGYGDTE